MSDIFYMPEILRRKKNYDRWEPSSFQVMGDEALRIAPFYPYNDFRGPRVPRRPANQLRMPDCLPQTSVLPYTTPDFRANNPRPQRCGIIEGNVKTMCEPIVDVYTNDTQHERNLWWPASVVKCECKKPVFTLDTTYREDYLKDKDSRPPAAGRFTANKNRNPSVGAVPVNSLAPKEGHPEFYQEKRSFEHIYDSRKDPNYPIRGKRQGAFVWEAVPPSKTKNFLEYVAQRQKEESYRIQPRTSLAQPEGWVPVKEKIGLKEKIPKGYAVFPADKPLPIPVYMRGPPEDLTDSIVEADIETCSVPKQESQTAGPS